MCNAFFTSHLFSCCVLVRCYAFSKLKSLETRAKFPTDGVVAAFRRLLCTDDRVQSCSCTCHVASYPVLIFGNGGFLQANSNTAHQTSNDLKSDFLSKKWVKHEEGTCWSVCSEAVKVILFSSLGPYEADVILCGYQGLTLQRTQHLPASAAALQRLKNTQQKAAHTNSELTDLHS